MTIFVDTSAFLSFLDAYDENHLKAKKKWEELISKDSVLVCSSYILVEKMALLQYRLGMDAGRVFQKDVVPLLTLEWINEPIHQAGIMRRLGIKTAFTFNRDFKKQGFVCIP